MVLIPILHFPTIITTFQLKIIYIQLKPIKILINLHNNSGKSNLVKSNSNHLQIPRNRYYNNNSYKSIKTKSINSSSISNIKS